MVAAGASLFSLIAPVILFFVSIFFAGKLAREGLLDLRLRIVKLHAPVFFRGFLGVIWGCIPIIGIAKEKPAHG